MNANNSRNPYPWLTGPAGESDVAAWDAYLKALRDQLQFDWAHAKSAYLSLKKVRESLGLPFIDTTPKTETSGPDESAWTPVLEAEAQDLQAMAVLITSALDDAISGKRKLSWDQVKGYFVIESLPSDVLRLEFDSKGVPRMVDAKTGSPTHVTGAIGVPNIVWAVAATATTSILALPAYFIADAAVNGMRVVAEQKTARVMGERAFDCVQSGKCTPAEAAAIAKAPYEGAAGVRAAAAKEKEAGAKETSDLMKAVTTMGWIALGLGVLYAAVRFIPPMGKSSAPMLPAYSPNPGSGPVPQSGYAYEYAGRNWRSTKDDNWDTVMISPDGAFKFVGRRRIDGSEVNVWKWRGKHVAQTVVLTGRASANPGVATKTRVDVANAIVREVNAGRRWSSELRAHARDDHSWHTVFIEQRFEGRGVHIGTITVYDSGHVTPRMTYAKQIGEWAKDQFGAARGVRAAA